MTINAQSGGNTFYWNNFTSTAGYYVSDSNGGNKYNTTMSGHGEGNIWFNVLSGAVQISGTSLSGYGGGLYYGIGGSGHPYSTSTSQGKLTGTVTDNAALTNVSNSAPVINSSRILPSIAYMNDTLKGYCSANDSDGNAMRYYYAWYKNGALNASGYTSSTFTQATEVNVNNLTAGIQRKNEQWIFSCLASDDIANSSWMNSSTLNISNLLPPQVNLSYPTSGNIHFINRTPTFNWSAVTDLDGDSVSYHLEVSHYSNFTDHVVDQPGLMSNNYTQPTELAFSVYYWRVSAYDFN